MMALKGIYVIYFKNLIDSRFNLLNICSNDPISALLDDANKCHRCHCGIRHHRSTGHGTFDCNRQSGIAFGFRSDDDVDVIGTARSEDQMKSPIAFVSNVRDQNVLEFGGVVVRDVGVHLASRRLDVEILNKRFRCVIDSECEFSSDGEIDCGDAVDIRTAGSALVFLLKEENGQIFCWHSRFERQRPGEGVVQLVAVAVVVNEKTQTVCFSRKIFNLIFRCDAENKVNIFNIKNLLF